MSGASGKGVHCSRVEGAARTGVALKRLPFSVEWIPMSEGQVDDPVAFAPEAHLPRERRLLVGGAGVTLEAGLGVRHVFPWAACEGVLLWPDRVELLLNDEVSIVIRAVDWHRGSTALDAIRLRAPQSLLVLMPADPEPEPSRYVLTGLATSSGVVLVLLVASLGLVGLIGLGIGEEDHRGSAIAVGAVFAAAMLFVLRALLIRLHVPRRWRDAAAVRGRMSVAVDTQLATSSDRALTIAEPVLYAVAGLLIGIWLTIHGFTGVLAVLTAGSGLAVRRERMRRRHRSQDH